MNPPRPPTNARSPLDVLDAVRSREGRWVTVLILGSAVLRLALGALVGPSVDESYAVVMSRRLALSYYDHPPLLFWIPGLAARLAGTESQFAVRLPFVLMFMATTWLTFRLGARLFHERAGLWAAVALNLILFFTYPVAGWVLPDGPLLLCSAAAALCLANVTTGTAPGARPEAGGPRIGRTTLAWMGFGLSTGLGLLSKYHALFVLAGAGLFLLTSKEHRAWLKRPEPYLAAVLALVVFLPVLVWNATHEWASIRFQGGRAVPLDAEQDAPFLGAIAGQAAWMLPWVWIPLLVVLVEALRRGPREPRRWLPLCLGVGPIAFFTLITLFGRRGLPHWQAPGYFMLLPLLGAWIAERLDRGSRWMRAWLWASTLGLGLVLLLLVTQVWSGWIARASPGILARGDPTDDLIQWRPVARQLRAWGYPKRGVVTAGATWADAAKLAYALGPRVPVASVGGDPRGFEFVRSQSSVVDHDVLLVARRRSGEMEPMLIYAPHFARLTPLGTIPLGRHGNEAILVSVYLGERLLAVPPPKPTR
jgi:4-amino-4-deoxy-L-arabinose transferase-like glycosyltransferase